MLSAARPLAPSLTNAVSAGEAPRALDQTSPRCRLCNCLLERVRGDALSTRLCRECGKRPEARALGPVMSKTPPAEAPIFGSADKALIRSVHGYMPAPQLLGVLNARRLADNERAAPYTIAQLQAEIHALASEGPTGGSDWASLRKTLATARASGLLDAVTEQTLQDFCVVFSLSPAQAVRLKDIITSAQCDGDDA
jgi:hypothetical protein